MNNYAAINYEKTYLCMHLIKAKLRGTTHCVVNINDIPKTTDNIGKSMPRPSWKRSSYEQQTNYKDSISLKLNNVNIPDCVIECNDIKCEHKEHNELIDNYVKDVLDAVDASAFETLFVNKQNDKKLDKKMKILAGWEEIKPEKPTAQFWHSLWISAQRPTIRVLHQIMKRTRAVYHYKLRKLKKIQDKIKADKLLNSCLNGGHDLFSQIKQMRKARSGTANKIDGEA